MSMMKRVSRLLEASQIVRLDAGWVEEGSRNGNRLNPAVRITPACARELATNVSSPAPWRRDANNTAMLDAYARNGANHRVGRLLKLSSHAPGAEITSFSNGLLGPLPSIALVIRSPSRPTASQMPPSVNATRRTTADRRATLAARSPIGGPTLSAAHVAPCIVSIARLTMPARRAKG